MTAISQTVQAMHTAMLPWIAFGQTYGSSLFGLLAVIEFGLLSVIALLKQEGIVAWFAEVMQTFIILCATFGMLLLGPTLMTQVIQSLTQFGATVSGVPSIQLSDLMDDGIDLIKVMLGAGVTAGIHLSFLPAAVLVISTVMIGWGYLRLGKSYLMALLESYAVVSVGAIMLGFGALRQTRVYPERYISAAIGSGAKLMVCYFLVGLEKLMIPVFSAQAKATDFSVFSTQDITGTLQLVFGIVLMLAVMDVDKLMSMIARGVVSFSGHDITARYMPFASAATSGAVGGYTMAQTFINRSGSATAETACSSGGGIPRFALATVGDEAQNFAAAAPSGNGNGTGSQARGTGRRVSPPVGNGNGNGQRES